MKNKLPPWTKLTSSGQPLLSDLMRQPPHHKAGLLVSVTVVYAGLFYLLHPHWQSGVATLAIMPVVVAGYLWGMGGGLLAGALAFPLNTLLLNLVGHSGWDVIWRSDGGAGTLALIFLGGLVGQLRDQHLRTPTELSLRHQIEADLRYQAHLFQPLPDAVIATDLEFRVTSWNWAAEQMYGWPAAATLGKPIQVVLQTDYLEGSFDAFVATLLQAHRWTGEVLQQDRAGTSLYIEASVEIVRNQAGQPMGTVMVHRDITRQKQVEIALNQAKHAAEQAAQAKAAFLANMSHEMRTPLNSVIGMTEVLSHTALTPEQHEYLEIIRQGGEALLAAVNNILDFSKIEANKLTMERAWFDLRACVETALDLVAQQAAQKGLDLSYRLDRTPDLILGDAIRLRQILLNLLNNALKFTDRGEVVVSVTASLVPPEALDWQAVTGITSASAITDPVYDFHFTVADTGIGIPPQHQARLFQAFNQADASITRQYGGTGLGLAISRRLSELLGGRMWLESAGIPGQGSTFHFTIRAPGRTDPDQAYLRTVQPHLQTKRCLILGANTISQGNLTAQLDIWGVRTQTLISSVEGVEALRQNPPVDLILTDTAAFDPQQLAPAIAAVTQNPPPPLILLTPLGTSDHLRPTDPNLIYLHKPIKPAQLYHLLQDLFNPGVSSPILAPVVPDHTCLGQTHPLRILLAEDNRVNQKVALRLLAQLGYQAEVAATGAAVLQKLAQCDSFARNRRWPGEGQQG